MHGCSYVATLLRPAALQVLQAYFFFCMASVAENGKTSPALGVTGGELQHKY